MQDNPQEINGFELNINIKEYIRLFLHWAWLIILITIVAGVTAFFITRQITPVYRATTTVLVNEAPVTRTSGDSLYASDRLTRTYADMMTKTPILEETSMRLGLTIMPGDLSKMITINPQTGTLLIEVVVESTDPVAAALIANTLVEVFSSDIEQVQSDRYSQSKGSLELKMEELENEISYYTALAESAVSETERLDNLARADQYRDTYYSLLELYENVWISEAQSISSLSIIEPANVPNSPVRPKVLQTTALAAVVGFLLTGGAIVASEALDDTLRTPEDINRYLGLPVLGMIDRFSKDVDKRLISVEQPRSPIAESFRGLRENVKFSSIDRKLHTLLITSPEPGEGKSTIAANLAVVFAQAGVDTILLDSDLRRPALHKFFGANNRFGLSSLLLQGSDSFDNTMTHSPIRNLRIIFSGSLPPNPAELLASERMKKFLENLKQLADLIILDTPPIMAVTDAATLAPNVDGVVLVIHPGKTRASVAKQTVEQLKLAQAKVLGVVLNPLDLKNSRYAYRYGHKNGRSYYREYYHESTTVYDSRVNTSK